MRTWVAKSKYPVAVSNPALATDSQSVKTTESGDPSGYDGGEKISGRKRQTLVDTEGDVLKVRVFRPIFTKAGGMLLLAGWHLWFPGMQLVRADTHYQGLKTWAKDRLGWTIEAVKHWWTGVQGFWLASRRTSGNSQRISCAVAPLGGGKNICAAWQKSGNIGGL